MSDHAQGRPKNLILTALLMLIVTGAAFWHRAVRQDAAQAARAAELGRRLQLLADRSDTESLLSETMRHLWQRIAGCRADSSEFRSTVDRWQSQFAPRACEIWLFSPTGAVLASWSDDHRPVVASAAASFFATLRRPWPVLEPGPLERPDALAVLLRTGTFPIRIRGRPDCVVGLHPRGRRTWAGWTADATISDPDVIGGMLVFWHRDRMPRGRPLSRAVQLRQRRGWSIGLIPRHRDTPIVPPPGLAADAVRMARDRWRETGDADGRAGHLIFVPAGDGDLLVGFVPPTPLPLPGWWLAAIGIILAAAGRGHRGSGPEGHPLARLLAGFLGVTVGVPLIITFLFWHQFAETRRQSTIAAELADMTRQLVEIDQLMPIELRRRQRAYRAAIAAVGADLERLTTVLDRFESHHTTGFTCVIDETGQHRQPFTNLNDELSWTLRLAPEARRRLLRRFVAQGYPWRQLEHAFAYDFVASDPNQILRRYFIPDQPEITRNITETVAAVGRELLRQANADRQGADTSDQASAMVVASVLESSAGGFTRRMMASAGGFFVLGSGVRKSLLFIDFARDRTGHARYFVFMFHDLVTIEAPWLRRLLAKPLPGFDRGVAAISGYAMSQFPSHRSRVQFRPLLARVPNQFGRFAAVAEPRPVARNPADRRVGPVASDGRSTEQPMLIAAVAGRHAVHYLYVGVRSFAGVEAQMAALRTELTLAGLAMALLLATICARLTGGLTRPTGALLAGMDAMTRRDLTHRIPLHGNGDEWDDLAHAFNLTLHDLRELEVARVIQERLLPTGTVRVGRVSFTGRCVMTSSVGGDFFDAIPIAGERLAFMLGDVSGHGVSAALVVAMIKAGFAGTLRSGIVDPGPLADRLSALLITHVKKVKMMTAAVGTIGQDGSLQLANAGHPWPVLLLPGQAPVMLKQVSFPLGTFAKRRYQAQSLQLPPGGRVVLYSDGVSEGLAPDQSPFGYDRLLDALGAIGPLAPPRLIEELQSRLRAYTRSEPWHDDVSIAVLATD